MIARPVILILVFSLSVFHLPPVQSGSRAGDIEALEQQLQNSPDNSKVKYLLAREYSYSGRYPEAIRLYEELLSEYPGNVDYLLGIGQSYLWNNLPEKSLVYLQPAAEQAPDYEDVQRALSMAYRDTGQHEKAGIIYQDALVRFDSPDWAIAGLQKGGHGKLPRYELYLLNRFESLDYNPDIWRESRLGITASLHEKINLGLFAEKGEHFKLDDKTYGISAVFSLPGKTWLDTEATLSTTHHFTPQYSLYGQLGHGLANGWGVLLGMRHRKYSGSTVNIIDASLEKYIGSYRMAYTLFASDSNTAGSALSHRLQAGYYFAGRNSVQMAITAGKEVDKVAAANQVTKTEFTDLSLWGEFWLDNDFGIEYGLGFTRLDLPVQGDSSRKHIQLGINYRF